MSCGQTKPRSAKSSHGLLVKPVFSSMVAYDSYYAQYRSVSQTYRNYIRAASLPTAIQFSKHRSNMSNARFPDFGISSLRRLREMPEDERKRELEQRRRDIDALCAHIPPAPPPMSPIEFLKQLSTLDISSQDDYNDFQGRTQCQMPEKSPLPVPLGTHYEYQYYLRVCSDTIEPDDYNPKREDAEDIYYGMSRFEARHAVTGDPADVDLKFGFGLGKLYHREASKAEPSFDEDLEPTGFYVICNAVDKSIWLAFDFEPINFYGDNTEYVRPERGDEYGKLPGDQDGLVVGVVKLYDRSWRLQQPPTLLKGDPFREAAGRPLACRLALLAIRGT